MSCIVMGVSVSLDGFAAGPDVSEAAPMGLGGEALHAWMFASPPDPVDLAVKQSLDDGIGAAIVGRRTYDLGLPYWGGTPWAGVPSFVVTHRPMDGYVAANGGAFSFGGFDECRRAARHAAGDRKVMVLGPNIGRQLLDAGDLDEIRLQVVPILLGGGVRLFDGQQTGLVAEEQTAGSVAHLRLRVVRP